MLSYHLAYPIEVRRAFEVIFKYLRVANCQSILEIEEIVVVRPLEVTIADQFEDNACDQTTPNRYSNGDANVGEDPTRYASID